MNPMLLVVATILGAGVFGGFANFYLSKPDEVPTPSRARSVIVGLAASFLVPLFLNMISSNLIDLIRDGDNSKLMVLLGFCLVASISSTTFIKTLSDRVLAEARQANRAAQKVSTELAEVQSTLAPIVARETEDEQTATAVGTAWTTELTNEQKILNALCSGRWALRSRSGLTRETGLAPELVGQLLDELKSAGMVGSRTRENGPRWFITEQGRKSLSELSF